MLINNISNNSLNTTLFFFFIIQPPPVRVFNQTHEVGFAKQTLFGRVGYLYRLCGVACRVDFLSDHFLSQQRGINKTDSTT